MRLGRGVAWAGAIGIAVGVLASAGRTFEGQEEPAPCCYTHADHAGVCEVTPGEGETCQSILDYLNTPMSTGKTYCGGTTIRGGWETAACEKP